MNASFPAFRKLCASGQLALLRESPRFMPRLLEAGLDAEDARALAWNVSLLYRVVQADPPLACAGEVLERYSLGEIADLCDVYRRVAAGELEYGEREEKT